MLWVYKTLKNMNIHLGLSLHFYVFIYSVITD